MTLMSATDKTVTVRTTVNGEEYGRAVEPRLHLADFLRDHLRLTGTKVGCEHGVCGSCTVLLDGLPVRSCLILAVQAEGRQVTTVESLSAGPELNPLQDAFKRCHALQCGFCTAGFLMTATALLSDHAPVGPDEVREHIGGNLCRCTGYQAIVDAIVDASQAGGR